MYNDESQIKTDEQQPQAGKKRKSGGKSEVASPAKKAKQQTKTSKDASSKGRKKNNSSSSVETSKKRTKQSKKVGDPTICSIEETRLFNKTSFLFLVYLNRIYRGNRLRRKRRLQDRQMDRRRTPAERKVCIATDFL